MWRGMLAVVLKRLGKSNLIDAAKNAGEMRAVVINGFGHEQSVRSEDATGMLSGVGCSCENNLGMSNL